MPLYEYQCQNCQAVRDIRHGFDETTSETCTECAGPLVRLFRPAGIVFKGSGFYVTDSRKPQSDGAKEAPKSDAPKADAPAKSESAPKSDAPAA